MVTPDLSALQDEELLRRYQNGELEAFGVLLQRYRRPVYNFLLRSVRSPDRAEDLLQEVFMRVVQRAGDFEGRSKFSTWMYTIARNLCIDTSRKMIFRRHQSLDTRPKGTDGEGGPLVERVAAKQPGADREVISEEIREHIAHAVEGLPAEQREVFLMRQLQGLSFKDIAEIVNVPENTVKSRMRYALERLQGALAEYRDYAHQLK